MDAVIGYNEGMRRKVAYFWMLSDNYYIRKELLQKSLSPVELAGMVLESDSQLYQIAAQFVCSWRNLFKLDECCGLLIPRMKLVQQQVSGKKKFLALGSE